MRYERYFIEICRSELSVTNADQSKRLKSDINQLKDELTRSRTDTNEKILSMKSTVSHLHDQVRQIDNRIEKMFTRMISVRVKMEKNPPFSF